MDIRKIKITYIGHTGFAVELAQVVFLFDYYNGQLPCFPEGKQLVVLCSHKHPDHFNPGILDLAEKHPDVVYLLSQDIRPLVRGIKRGQVHFVKKNAHYEFTLGAVRFTLDTLRSTDLGVAFCIVAEGKCIYHAGDLNWWAWKGARKASLESMAKRFKEEVGLLKGRKLDVAFLTLDDRLEENMYLGMDYFLETIDVKQAFPMHFWEHFEVIPQYKARPEAAAWQDKVMEIQEMGQVFDYKVGYK